MSNYYVHNRKYKHHISVVVYVNNDKTGTDLLIQPLLRVYNHTLERMFPMNTPSGEVVMNRGASEKSV